MQSDVLAMAMNTVQKKACPRKIQPAEATRASSVSNRVSGFSSQSKVDYENIDEVQSTQNPRLDTVYDMVEGPSRAAGEGRTMAGRPKNPMEVESVYHVLHKV